MQITIVYATYSNSTALACEQLCQLLTNAGHSVSLQTATETTKDTLLKPELLVLASPSWDYNGQQGMPHEDFLTMQQAVGDVALQGKLTAILALGDSSFTYFCGAADHLTKWLADHGGKAVVPPLMIDQYYANEATARQQIADWSTQLLDALATKQTA